MGVFRDLYDLSTPWRFSTQEWKDKVNNSNFGSPIHGLRAGYEMTKLGSAYRLKQGINRINDGQNPFSSEFIRGTANDQGNNVASAVKENWPVMLAMLGGAMSGGSSGADGAGTVGDSGSGLLAEDGAAGDAMGQAVADSYATLPDAGGAIPLTADANIAAPTVSVDSGSGLLGSAGKYGQAGSSLLSQAKPQQQQPAPYSQPVDTQKQQRARLLLLQENQLQQLRMKPNKTMADYMQLAQLNRNQGLLGQ